MLGTPVVEAPVPPLTGMPYGPTLQAPLAPSARIGTCLVMVPSLTLGSPRLQTPVSPLILTLGTPSPVTMTSLAQGAGLAALRGGAANQSTRIRGGSSF